MVSNDTSLSFQHGQVLLIVVLVMVVALTVGLSLASRSISNLRNASEQVNSEQAFSAAEAGVEQALKFTNQTGLVISNEQLDNNTYIDQVTIDQDYGRSIFLINNGNPLPQDDGADIWLSTYPDYSAPQFSGNLQIYWGTNVGCSDAALEIIVIKGTRAHPSVDKYAVDPCTTRGNNFDSPTGSGATILGHVFKFSTAVALTNGLLARVIPFYTGTPVAVVGTDTNGAPQLLPLQGKLITAVGSYIPSGSTTKTQRKISYFAGYDELPSELFYSIFQTP